MNKMSQILVSSGVKVKIKNLLGFSYPTIREALNGRSNTDNAKKIRTLALELGGVEKPKC